MTRSKGQWFRLSVRIALIMTAAILLELTSLRHDIVCNLTGSLKYELTARTKKVLDLLKKDVHIIYFAPRDLPETELMQNMLILYSSYSPKVKWKILDPIRNPMLLKRYHVAPEGKVTVVKYGNKVERVVVFSENDLTNAILRLITKRVKVYFLLRDGEYNPFDPDNIYTKVLDFMEDENFAVKPLYWKNADYNIPSDAELIIVWRPEKEFSGEEIRRFDAYLNNGGKLLFMLGPFTVYSLNKLLNRFHVIIKDDIVVDKSSRLIGGDMFMPMVMPSMFKDCLITNHLGSPIMLPMAHSVNIVGPAPKGWDVKVVLKTNPDSWTISKKSYDKWEFDYIEGHGKNGSIPVAVGIKELGRSGKGGRMIVVGNADFAVNSYIDLPGTDNRYFFMNIIEWLTNGEKFVFDRPKAYKYNYRSLKENERKMLLYVIVALPACILIIGMAIYFRIKKARI